MTFGAGEPLFIGEQRGSAGHIALVSQRILAERVQARTPGGNLANSREFDAPENGEGQHENERAVGQGFQLNGESEDAAQPGSSPQPPCRIGFGSPQAFHETIAKGGVRP